MNKLKAEKRLEELNIKHISLIEYKKKKIHIKKNWFEEYKKTRMNFVQSLSDSIEELVFFNFSREEFISLIMGKSIPNNISIKFKIPIFLGGIIDERNMFICKTFPYSFNIDRFILEQIDNDILWLPCPKTKIYNPVGSFDLGGGNSNKFTQSSMVAKNDRR